MRYPAIMDIPKILAELIQERDQLNQAILSLERLTAGQGKRRGRPPAWLQNIKTAAPVAVAGPKRRGRPPGKKNKTAA
jgi:hypothetical protein